LLAHRPLLQDPVHFEVFQELLAKEGINGGKPIDDEFFRTKIAGRQNALICADLFPSWDTQTAEQWSADKEAAFRDKAVGKLKPMRGLDEVMTLIEELGLKKAAVTNAPRLNAEFMLNVIGRFDWFDTVVIGDECERAKPDPLPYALAMDRLGVSPHECIVIEDSPSGAQAGVASGAWTVGILTSQPSGVLKKVGCKLLIQDYTDQRFLQVLKGESV
jgi:HAD superfamily hydrolase (TIGR01509 family)